jgi:hypothetical protein
VPLQVAVSIAASVGLYLSLGVPLVIDGDARRQILSAPLPAPTPPAEAVAFMAMPVFPTPVRMPIEELVPTEAPVSDEPIDDPLLADAREAEQSSNEPEGDGEALDGEALAEGADGSAGAAGEPGATGEGRGRRTRPKRDPPPCTDATTAIVAVEEGSYRVDRTMIEFYATHVNALMDLASVWPHDGADGRPDGFKVRFRRCTLLHQAGLRTGDVVHDINGRKVNNLMQAVGAWFALRDEPEIRVTLSRRDGDFTLVYQIEGNEQQTRDAARALRAELREDNRDRREDTRDRRQADRDRREARAERGAREQE